MVKGTPKWRARALDMEGLGLQVRGLLGYRSFALAFRGLGFQGSRVQGFKGLRVQGFKGLRVQGFQGLRVSGLKGFRVPGYSIGAPPPCGSLDGIPVEVVSGATSDSGLEPQTLPDL